jgi:hypothetical protein
MLLKMGDPADKGSKKALHQEGPRLLAKNV